jgi:hypothetical protein
MGTSGNRKGYKIFSINTTVRNPKRNVEFLKLFQPFDGQVISASEMATKYLFSLVKTGTYSFMNITESVKDKIRNDIDLTNSEVDQAFTNNPQATGFRGRALTHLRALRDQGFLMFDEVKRDYYKMEISKLGQELIKNEMNSQDIYSKAMIGMHANSPVRPKLLNQSRPFLNTLFVIDGVNREWAKLGKDPKGILTHEFAVFVLSMKDCDYNSAITNIINYRKQYGLVPNKIVIEKFLAEQEILALKYESIIKDYADEVFRKFEMTGLLIQHGSHKYIYYNFSAFNKAKVDIVLEKYKNYTFEEFATSKSYYDYLFNIELTWLIDTNKRKAIVEAKAKLLNIKIDTKLSLQEIERKLEDKFNESLFAETIKEVDEKTLLNELLILSGTINTKSVYGEIPEPLRLEYITALLIAKKFGANGLIANMIMGEDGLPLSYAPAGRPDIIFEHIDGSYIFELTMAKNANQQLNSETSSVADHAKQMTNITGIEYRTALIAPFIHARVAQFYQFCIMTKKVKMSPISIDRFVQDMERAQTIANYTVIFDSIVLSLQIKSENEYVDEINKRYAI